MGKPSAFQTSIKEESPPGVRIDALFTTTVGKDPAVVYNLFGTYFPLKENFLNTLEITVIEPTFGKAAPDGHRCVRRQGEIDGRQTAAGDRICHRWQRRRAQGDRLSAEDCPPKHAGRRTFADGSTCCASAADFVSSGKIEAVENQYLHEWFGGLADGTVTVASEQ